MSIAGLNSLLDQGMVMVFNFICRRALLDPFQQQELDQDAVGDHSLAALYDLRGQPILLVICSPIPRYLASQIFIGHVVQLAYQTLILRLQLLAAGFLRHPVKDCSKLLPQFPLPSLRVLIYLLDRIESFQSLNSGYSNYFPFLIKQIYEAFDPEII